MMLSKAKNEQQSDIDDGESGAPKDDEKKKNAVFRAKSFSLQYNQEMVNMTTSNFSCWLITLMFARIPYTFGKKDHRMQI